MSPRSMNAMRLIMPESRIISIEDNSGAYFDGRLMVSADSSDLAVAMSPRLPNSTKGSKHYYAKTPSSERKNRGSWKRVKKV